jgi:transposase
MEKSLDTLSKDELISTVSYLNGEVERLKHQVSLFQKALFGPKNETFKQAENKDQLSISFDEKIDLDLPQDIPTKSIIYTRKQGRRTDYSKFEIPADIERVEQIIEPADKTEDMVKIGEEVTELLAIVPQKFYVKKIIRPKYAKANKEGVAIAELPSRPVQGGKIDVSFLVVILMDKYLDHLPLYRQLKRYERLGIKISDSTIGDWAAEGMKLLEYLYIELVKKVKESGYLQVDETPIQVLDKLLKGKTHRGYYWVYHDVGSGLVLYDYDPGRGKSPPQTFLSEFTGVIQVDGYGVYENLGNKNITIASCMAHARRYFFDAMENDKTRAEWMLDKIKLLYAVEDQARKEGLNNIQRQELRQKQSVPVLEEMEIWLKENIQQIPPSLAISKAMTYMLKRWDKLCYFTKNGRIEIDNNLIENSIRPIALGRKNYLFAGSHQSAKRAGIMYSFLTCCKKNGYDPYTWLTETLSKIPDMKPSELHTLLPLKKQDGV